MEKGFTITYEYGDNLYVNPTNRCNFNCNFCLRHNQTSGGSIFPPSLGEGCIWWSTGCGGSSCAICTPPSTTPSTPRACR